MAAMEPRRIQSLSPETMQRASDSLPAAAQPRVSMSRRMPFCWTRAAAMATRCCIPAWCSQAPTGSASSILTAQQIASLDLSGVDWAVLSACNTGNGEINDGEGVMGLERAFRVAGAHSVIMTLWPVDNAVTREFMRGLYAERFGRRTTTATASWIAARKLLLARQAAGKSTHPWYWAGIVAAGDWR